MKLSPDRRISLLSWNAKRTQGRISLPQLVHLLLLLLEAIKNHLRTSLKERKTSFIFFLNPFSKAVREIGVYPIAKSIITNGFKFSICT
jgi:hypothetical protein